MSTPGVYVMLGGAIFLIYSGTQWYNLALSASTATEDVYGTNTVVGNCAASATPYIQVFRIWTVTNAMITAGTNNLYLIASGFDTDNNIIATTAALPAVQATRIA